MAVVVPSGQPTQLVGLPPLSEKTYAALGRTFSEMVQKYYQAAPPAPSACTKPPTESEEK